MAWNIFEINRQLPLYIINYIISFVVMAYTFMYAFVHYNYFHYDYVKKKKPFFFEF